MIIVLFGVCFISVQTLVLVNTDKTGHDSVINNVLNNIVGEVNSRGKSKANPMLSYEAHGDEILIHFDLGSLRMDFTVPKNTTIDSILKKFIKTAFNSIDYWNNLKEAMELKFDFLRKSDGNVMTKKKYHISKQTLPIVFKPTLKKSKHTTSDTNHRPLLLQALSDTKPPLLKKPNHRIQTITPELELKATLDVTTVSNARNESVIHRIADDLFTKIHIVCLVMTTPDGHQTKAIHVKATWGRRCNTLLFMSSEKDTSLPTVRLPVYDDQDYLWSKAKESLRYVYKNYRKNADWVLKVDDDSYIIMENLRYLLVEYDSTFPFYLGNQKFLVQEGYLRGSAGYVLSRGALERFVNQGPNPPSPCQPDGKDTIDMELSICLDRLGCTALKSQDTLHRSRFFSTIPRESLATFNAHSHINGFDCCSDYVISFKHVEPQEMYALEYLIYRLKTFTKMSTPSYLMV